MYSTSLPVTYNNVSKLSVRMHSIAYILSLIHILSHTRSTLSLYADGIFLSTSSFFSFLAVSYTHLDVYKRQVESSSSSAEAAIFTTLPLEAIAAVVCVVLSFTEAVVSCVPPAVVCISVLSAEADIVVLLLFLSLIHI